MTTTRFMTVCFPCRRIWPRDPQQFCVARCEEIFQDPLDVQRVFKVEQFYCVIKVKDAKRLTPGQAYMNQMDVAVQFTNTKP
jgi:hypothetical protein